MTDVVTPINREARPRVMLVTGATGGLGRAVAKSLAALGHIVILSGRNIQALELLYDEIEAIGSEEPAMYPIDLAGANDDDYLQMASTLEEEFGRLDGIAHCAVELGLSTPLEKYAAATWASVMRVNVDSQFLMTRACLPLLSKTQNASVAFSVDQRHSAFWGAYGVSKAALLSLMRILADETEGFRDESNHPKVAVNAVHPGRMRTKLRAVAFSGELPEESPLPEERAAGFLKVLLREDPALTGNIVYLDIRDAATEQLPSVIQ